MTPLLVMGRDGTSLQSKRQNSVSIALSNRNVLILQSQMRRKKQSFGLRKEGEVEILRYRIGVGDLEESSMLFFGFFNLLKYGFLARSSNVNTAYDCQ